MLGRDFSRVPTFADLDALDYTGRILKESLRLNPTAPGFAKFVQRDTVIGGKYPVKKGGVLLTFLGGLHRNPRHFGPNPETFNPITSCQMRWLSDIPTPTIRLESESAAASASSLRWSKRSWCWHELSTVPTATGRPQLSAT